VTEALVAANLEIAGKELIDQLGFALGKLALGERIEAQDLHPPC
jgi:hypothetical protein